jgi:translation initiation factor 2A
LKQRCEIKRINLLDLWLSPQGSFMATWERYSKNPNNHHKAIAHLCTPPFFYIAKLEDGSGAKNLNIWDTETGELIASFVQKAQNNW